MKHAPNRNDTSYAAEHPQASAVVGHDDGHIRSHDPERFGRAWQNEIAAFEEVVPPHDPLVAPRVSILIPNFNNGRLSSVLGRHDLLARLLESLVTTLQHDRTPFEILAHDDGSTDDSQATLRHWATERVRPGSRHTPFFASCTFGPHIGVLSVIANQLVLRARGDIIVRLDGDIRCLTPNWVTTLVGLFDAAGPNLGVIGPKQLGIDGRMHAFGDVILHAKGYHHLGHGLPRDAFDDRSPGVDVEHVMGAFYCCRREVFDTLGGFDEQMLRGQTIDFGLRARLAGFRCMVTPDFEFEHAHKLRWERSTKADQTDAMYGSLATFERKWGFSRLVPDLDRVRHLYRNTPLLWHSGLSEAPPAREAKASAGSAVSESPSVSADELLGDPTRLATAIQSSDWGRYSSGDEATRGNIDWLVALVQDVHQHARPVTSIGEIGCGEGLAGSLISQRLGATWTGFDHPSTKMTIGRVLASRQSGGPSAARIRFADIPAGGSPSLAEFRLPCDDACFDLLLVREQLSGSGLGTPGFNPVHLLREAVRVLRPGGFMIVVEPQPGPRADADADADGDADGDGDGDGDGASSSAFDLDKAITLVCGPDLPWPREDVVAVVGGIGGFDHCRGPAHLQTPPDGRRHAMIFSRREDDRIELAGDAGRHAGPLHGETRSAANVASGNAAGAQHGKMPVVSGRRCSVRSGGVADPFGPNFREAESALSQPNDDAPAGVTRIRACSSGSDKGLSAVPEQISIPHVPLP